MRVGRLFIIAAVICSASLPIFTRALGADGWNAIQSSGARSLFAAIMLAVLLRSHVMGTHGFGRWLVLNGLMLVVGSSAYIFAMSGANNGIVTAIGFLGPVWILCFERFVQGQRRPGDILACGLGFTGAMLAASNLDMTKAIAATTLLAGLTASVVYATALITLKPVSGRVAPLTMTFWAHAVAGLVLSPSLVSAPWSMRTTSIVAMFALVNGIGFFAFLYAGLKRMRSSEASILSYSEMIFAWMLSVFYFGDVATPRALLGTALVAASGFIIARRAEPTAISSPAQS